MKPLTILQSTSIPTALLLLPLLTPTPVLSLPTNYPPSQAVSTPKRAYNFPSWTGGVATGPATSAASTDPSNHNVGGVNPALLSAPPNSGFDSALVSGIPDSPTSSSGIVSAASQGAPDTGSSGEVVVTLALDASGAGGVTPALDAAASGSNPALDAAAGGGTTASGGTPALDAAQGGSTPALDASGGGVTPALDAAPGLSTPAQNAAQGGSTPALDASGGGGTPALNASPGWVSPALNAAEGGSTPALNASPGWGTPALNAAQGGSTPALNAAQGGSIPALDASPNNTGPTIDSATIPDVAISPPTGPTQKGAYVGACRKWRVAREGDSCALVTEAEGVGLESFYAWNPAVNEGGECRGLWIGYAYCVGV